MGPTAYSRAVSSLLSTSFALLFCFGARASPLPTNDQNPFLAGFGLPRSLDARLPASSAWALDFNWASTALVEDARGEFLVADAETRELRLTYGHRVAERWAIEVQLPYRHTSGGSLDSFIDDWHDFFGLPEGARPLQAEDRLHLYYSRNDVTLIEHYTTIEGLMDASLSIIYALHSSERSAASAALSVKAPTGKDHWLNSSGAVDVSAVISGEHRFGDRWTVSGQAAATSLGKGDLLPSLQRDLVWSGRAGLALHATPALDFVLQMDGHTRVFDGAPHLFDDALIATLGGHINFRSGWTLSLGVSEDIAVEHSPDVVFVIGVTRR